MGVATVAVFSLLLAVIPLSVFHAATQGRLDAVYEAILGAQPITPSSRLILAGVTGVVFVNLVVAAFLVAAWLEPAPRDAERTKDD